MTTVHAVVIGGLLAFAATWVLVPYRRALVQLAPVRQDYAVGDIEFGWMWQLGAEEPYTLDKRGAPRTHVGPPRTYQMVYRIVWPVLIVEQIIVLVVGGGLLVFAIRRNRRITRSGAD